MTMTTKTTTTTMTKTTTTTTMTTKTTTTTTTTTTTVAAAATTTASGALAGPTASRGSTYLRGRARQLALRYPAGRHRARTSPSGHRPT
eukprot:12487319-Alexandrium_andersonii.AAC.1